MISPYFSKYFIVFSFASEHTIVGVLLQKNQLKAQHPIAFFSKILRYVELKYDIMDEQAYALIKSLKDLRVYIFYFDIISYVPNNAINNILTPPYLERRRSKWIAVLLEYDLEINHTKLIKGQQLAKLMTDTNC